MPAILPAAGMRAQIVASSRGTLQGTNPSLANTVSCITAIVRNATPPTNGYYSLCLNTTLAAGAPATSPALAGTPYVQTHVCTASLRHDAPGRIAEALALALPASASV
jgi:hypothetical protein